MYLLVYIPLHSYKQTERVKGFPWMSNLRGLSKNLVDFPGNTLISSLIRGNGVCGALLGSAWLPEPHVPRERGFLTSASDLRKVTPAWGSKTSFSSPQASFVTPANTQPSDQTAASKPVPWRSPMTSLLLIQRPFLLPRSHLPQSLLFIRVISGTVDTIDLVSPWIPWHCLTMVSFVLLSKR